jgi:pseudouridine synthase
VRVRGIPDRHALQRLARGVIIDGRRTLAATVRLSRTIESSGGSQSLLSLVVREGRNRQVRKMCDEIGHPVVRLRRVRIGPIVDDRLRPGEVRDLTPREVAALRRA